MTRDSDTNNGTVGPNFKLDAPAEYRERMTDEMDKAPTYTMQIEPGESGPRIITLKDTDMEGAEVGDGELSVEHLSQRLPENLNPGPARKIRYETKEKLGEGGVGEVYEALDYNMNRPVAIKMIKDDQDRDTIELFLQEGSLAAEMEHPNIVPVYDLDVDSNGRLFMSMKKVDGKTLETVITENSDLSVEEIVTIFLKVCDALRYAHSKGRIHQDIKPANIMLGKFGEVFLIDWGAASESGDQIQISPVYMSPEQAQGLRATPMDDIYCLGASMFHILTRRYPTNAKTIDELWDLKVEGKIDLPTKEEYQKVPPSLLAIAMKAMEPEIEDRYPSVEAFADDLMAFHGGFATSAENASALRLLQLLLKRRWKETLVSAIILVAFLAFGITHVIQVHRAEVAQLSAELEVTQLEREKQAQELEVQRLERQKREQWLPLVSADFTPGSATPNTMYFKGQDLTLNEDGLDLGRLTIPQPIPIEFQLYLTFVCESQPSLSIRVGKKTASNWRVIEISSYAEIIENYKGWLPKESGPAIIRDVIFPDKINHLYIRQSQGRWSVELNDQPVLEYYDPEVTDSGETVSLFIGRLLGLEPIAVQTLTISQRQPPEYVNVLVPGKTLLQNRQFDAARAWFRNCADSRPATADEAAYLIALSYPGTDAQTQYDAFEAVANNPTSDYRLEAYKRMVELSPRIHNFEDTLTLLETVKKAYPNWEPGAGMEAVKRGILQLPSEDQKSMAQRVASLRNHSLDLYKMQITRLPKLNPQTKSLSISEASVSDISGLKGLRLFDLYIASTQVTDLTPLEGMGLKVLNISATKVNNLSALAGMDMESLIAKNMKVPIDLSTVSDLSIKKPIFDGSRLLHPDRLKRLNAGVLRLNDCGLTDLKFLSGIQGLHWLKASNNAIERVDGLEGLQLGSLALANNKITSLEGVQACQLTGYADFNGNPISDITPLKGQPLTNINLDNTAVTDLSVIRYLPNIRVLSIKGSASASDQMLDLRSLGPCSLESLSISNQKIRSLDPLAVCTITGSLNVSDNPLSELAPIKKHPITDLDITNTAVASLAPLKTMITLEELYAGATDAAKPSPLKTLEGIPNTLKTLRVWHCPVQNLTPLATCNGLTKLYLDGLSVTDYSPLANLPLVDLRVTSPGVSNIPALGKLTSLNFLTIEGTRPNDPAGLVSCPKLAGLELAELSLKNNRITDISWLKTARVTRFLNVSGNPISDIEPLTGQPLRRLDLSNTLVTDFSVIKTMPNLKSLIIRGVTLTEPSKKFLASMELAIDVTYE